MTSDSHSPELVSRLSAMARQLRVDSLNMIHKRGQGHPGGSLSAAEVLAALYFHHLRLDPSRKDWAERDRFILSKGHASAILYAALARRGYFALSELDTWGHLDSHLQGHPDRFKTAGVEMSTGCLGHGVSIGAGLCLAARLRKLDYRTYVLVGDGECQAGVVWEGAMLATKYRLNKLTVILDSNEVQLDGRVDEIMPLEPLRRKWESFGWAATEMDGHDMKQVLDTLDEAHDTDRPSLIIAHTVKGKGVSFMEGKAEWHGKAPNADELARALAELNAHG